MSTCRPGPSCRRDGRRLELGVGQDDPALAGDAFGAGVDGEGQAPELGRRRPRPRSPPRRRTHVLVVLPQLGLGGGGEDRLRQPAAVLEPLGQCDPAHLARGPVVDEARAGEVAARDALDREHREPLADDRAAVHGDRDVRGQDVVRQEVRELLEPPQGHPGEDLPLVRDVGAEHVVERGDPVARHHQQLPGVRPVLQLVEVADLAGVDVPRSVDDSCRRQLDRAHGPNPRGGLDPTVDAERLTLMSG